ncbi:MAG: hypothetical protein WBD34_11510, partial [Burkholderiaceae bacterium]
MKTLFMASVVASTLVLAACGDDDTTSSVSSDPVVNSDPTQNQGDPVGTTTNSVIDLAVATPELSILVEAVTAAGLVDTL